jgi:hypothetical protein
MKNPILTQYLSRTIVCVIRFRIIVPLALLFSAIAGQSQVAQPEILERGPHSRLERVQRPPSPKDLPPYVPPNRNGNGSDTYTVLETGMNYYSEDERAWKPSEEVIEILNGVGVARRGQQKVIFSANLNTEGSIDLLTPDGTRLRASVLALTYFDAMTGAQVTLGAAKDSTGKLIAPNQIIYQDAFDNIKADVLYTWKKSGLEQDVILRERVPAPELLGLTAASTRLQVMTEFFDAPAPQTRQQVLRSLPDPRIRALMVEPDFLDEELSFGGMQLQQGRAFYLENALGKRPERHEDTVIVGKQWLQQDARTILLESVEFTSIQPFIKNLPDLGRRQAWLDQKEKNKKYLAALGPRRIQARTLPGKLQASTQEKKEIFMADAGVENNPGFVLDYETISSQSNFTFRGDTTYYIDGSVYLSGTTTLEGGAVIKHRPRATSSENDPRLFIQGPFVCNTSAYRPAIITAKDDNTVGSTISGSDGDPSNPNKFAYYGIYFYFSANAVTLKHVRISYAYWGALFNDNLSYTHTLRHLQFTHCTFPIYSQKGSGGNTVLKAQNVLIDGGDEAFYTWNCDVVGENLTIKGTSNLYYNIGGSTYSLKNSLLTGITTIQSYTRNTETDNKNNPSGTIYQTVAAGNSYLANSSPFRNAGITTIDSGLLADLRTRTTYPPIQLTGTASADVTLSPVIVRDTDTPDIGYHYPAVDYALQGYTVSGRNVKITPGTALIAIADTGLWITAGTQLKCQGLAEAPIEFAPYYLIQEQSVNFYASGMGSSVIINPYSNTTAPNALISFTHFNAAPSSGYSLYASPSSTWRYSTLTIKSCEFKGGWLEMGGLSGNSYILFNNLFERGVVNVSGYHLVTAKNNLFYKASLGVDNFSTAGNWIFYYNIFDQTSISELSQSTANGYNGYVGSSPTQLLGSSGGNTVVATFSYASGPFGPFYQSSTSFVDHGNVTASSLALTHFTTSSVNTSKDTGNVDFGYHLPAVNSTAIPYDSDSDRLPDYFEDANGNLTYDAGTETNWQTADTDGDALTDFAEVVGGHFGEANYVNLPGLGANPLHADLFIEADYYMNYGAGSVSLRPYDASTNAVVAAFAAAPRNNPDGVTGISMHFDVSDGIDTTLYTTAQLDLDPVDAERDAFKAIYFTPGREDYFHWCLFADKYGPNGSLGSSGLADLPGDDFIVTVGPTFWGTRSVQIESGTIMHELGHNLNLQHGGNDGVNYKPNYLSVMNYTYQLMGLTVSGVSGRLDYSRLQIASVNEASLSEPNGFGAVAPTTETQLVPYGVYIINKGWIHNNSDGASANLDFNFNGSIQPSLIATTLNNDADSLDTFAASQNDWNNIVFNGGQIGEGFQALSAPNQVSCKTPNDP